MADTHIKIKPVTPRVQYTANGSTTVFPYSFAIFDETDMVVYVDDTIITTGYTVSGAGQTDGGEVTFDSAPVDGTIITLLRNVPIERMTDFQEGGTFRPKNLNDEFDRQTAFAQQVQEALSRCVKVDPTSESNPEEILPKVERLYDSADNIDIVANDKANVDAVAGNQTNIDSVAGNENNINTVAGISSDVSTVAGNTTDISNVATNMSDVNDCATNMEAIQAAPSAASSAATSAEQAAISAAGTHFKLFHHDWFDYQLNDMAWLRADTFSWQDGTVYTNAYNHLVDEFLSGQLGQSETIAGITIFYNLAPDGHKIVDASYPEQVQHVEDIYNATGVAWYYILDTTNQRFKLPRTKWGFVGLRDTVGKYVPESLPDHYHKMRVRVDVLDGYQGIWRGGSDDVGYAYENTNNASETNPIYQSGAPVQQRATQQYLYFYVGQFSQSATEQTAGLNSELFNGKVDLDAANLSTAGKSLISGLGMPSSRYIDLTLGASGATYTAPANGYLFLAKMTTGSQNIQLIVNGTTRANSDYFTCMNVYTSGTLAVSWVPVKKGDVVTVHYNTGGTTEMFRFIYAEGEPNV